MTRLILSSAYRIGPFEVEPALIEHKAVLEAADVAKPDADRDQIVTVYAVLVEGAVPSGDLEAGLQKHVKRTTEAIDEDGWMHTGDLATMDAHGYVNIVGRIKDMIIRGGENVYPREIEEYLYSHPAVQDVQVIGVPDRRLGEEIMAWVQLLPGNDDITDEHLKDFCRGRIAHFKVPRYIKFVDDFPMTVTGKVQKFKMREQSIDELGLYEEASVRNT